MDRPHEPVSPQPGESEESGHQRSPYGFRSAASLVTDPAGRIREADMAALRLLNTDQQRLLGRPVSSLVPPQHRSRCRHFIRRVRRSGEAASWTLLLQSHQRRPVPVDMTVVPVCGHGGMVTRLRWVLQEERDSRLESLKQELDEVRQGLAGIRWILETAGSQIRWMPGDPEKVSSVAGVIGVSQRFLVEAQRPLRRFDE
ncbi:MAG: PAS domain-containing protein [Dehalococcoidia bacterium]